MKGGKTVKVKPGPQNRVPPGHIVQGSEHVASLQWSSPLPPPQVMSAYMEASPDLVASLLHIIERQNEHHCEMERENLEAQCTIRLREEGTKRLEVVAFLFGKVIAAVIAIAGFALCGYFARLGYPKLATLLCGGELAGLVALFLRSRKGNQAN